MNYSKQFQNLYSSNKEKLLNFITRRVNSREDAEDITSDVFMKIYKALPEFRWQGVSMESWMYKIARNSIIDYHRKNSKRKPSMDIEKAESKIPDQSADLLSSLMDGEEESKLYSGLSRLSTIDQYLVFYKYFEELSLTEIAQRLNLTTTNVATRLHRLRSKMLKFMQTNENSTKA